MRLLVVSSWFPWPPDNGSRLRAYHLIEQLARHHQVTLLACHVPGEPTDAGPLASSCARVTAVSLPAGSPDGRWTDLLSRTPRSYARLESPTLRAALAREAAGHDAVLALQAPAGYLVRHLAGSHPMVLDEVELGAFEGAVRSARGRIRRARRALTWWKYQRFIERLAARFDRVTVVSEVERRLLVEAGCEPGRIAIVPNGVDVPPAREAARRALRLVYPGSVRFSANLDAVTWFVDHVFPLVRARLPGIRFCVTGSVEGVDVHRLARVEGVEFTGTLPDVRLFVAESLACVVPLRQGGGTRLKVLEAMALGTPVLSTSKGIEGLEVEPDGHVLVADDPWRLAEQVVRVAGDVEFADRVAAAARAFVVERHQWLSVAATLNAVLADAVRA